MAVSYGLSFWLPQMLKDSISGVPWKIGLLSAIPWLVGAVGMILWGQHSDKTRERRWHFLSAAVLAAITFSFSALPQWSPTVRVLILAIAALGVLAAQSVFWTMPTELLTKTASAAGIAWINSIGNLSGFLSPYLVGLVRDRTHNMALALVTLSALCLVAGLIAPMVVRKRSANATLVPAA
jgi:nitrate/nitrite transporter NarK